MGVKKVTDLEALVRDVKRTTENRGEAALLDSATVATIPALCQDITSLLQDLDSLIHRCIKDEAISKNGSSTIKVKKIAWLRAAERMKEFQAQIRAVRLRMATSLASILS